MQIVPPDSSISVEEVLLAAGEQVGHDSLCFASRMNKAVVVFVKDEPLVHQLVQSGVFIRDLFVQVSPPRPVRAPLPAAVPGPSPLPTAVAVLRPVLRAGPKPVLLMVLWTQPALLVHCSKII